MSISLEISIQPAQAVKWRRSTASQELYSIVLVIHCKMLRRLEGRFESYMLKSREKWILPHFR